jgi:hypothetical protein
LYHHDRAPDHILIVPTKTDSSARDLPVLIKGAQQVAAEDTAITCLPDGY